MSKDSAAKRLADAIRKDGGADATRKKASAAKEQQKPGKYRPLPDKPRDR